MTFFLEISKPFQWRPGKTKLEDSMVRFWWMWFAFGWLRVPFKEFVMTSYNWADEYGRIVDFAE